MAFYIRTPRQSLFILILLLANWEVADALDILKGVMPGEVSHLHEKYEGKCLECHTLIQKQFFDKCLACHKEVKGDVEKKGGFHGKIDASQCETCHREHQGRGNTLIVFNPERFDHKQTDFALAGKHQEVKCTQCHLKPKYRETPHDCYSCHVKDDKHKGSLGKQCERCHNANAWSQISFDHSKTRFSLEGKHQKVECEACHKSDDFKTTPMTCIGCHRKDNKHKGTLGPQCEQCHTANTWKKNLFDHDKTRFRLVGKHEKVDCLKCHITPELRSTPKNCYGCHKRHDRHKGRLGKECERCHSAENWKRVSFDHSTTQYPLMGKHLKAGCAQCHMQERWKISSQCLRCHRKDDKHKGRLGEACEQCHTEVAWKDVQKFDHQKTSFPLLGKHDKVRCGECHKTPLFKDTPSICYSCHKKDDYHKRKFGEKCDFCHTAEDWKRHTFDHTKETGYPLQGKHRKVTCEKCHIKPLFVQKTSRMCVQCHRQDDAHDGELGFRCEICHTEASFKVILKTSLNNNLLQSNLWPAHFTTP